MTPFEAWFFLSHISLCRKASLTWWPLLNLTSGVCSAGSCPTALAGSSVWRPWRWPWRVARSTGSSIRAKVAKSCLPTLWNGFGRSRSVGQAGNVALTHPCGTPVADCQVRGRRLLGEAEWRCISEPMKMAGLRRSAWHTFSGGTAM